LELRRPVFDSPLARYSDFFDFAGDVIIQNGANSMVGLSVIQLANARGIKTINIIRRTRTDYAELIERMKNYGAYMVRNGLVGSQTLWKR